MQELQNLPTKLNNLLLHSCMISNDIGSLVPRKNPRILSILNRFLLYILRDNLLNAPEGDPLPNFFKIDLPLIILILLAQRLDLLTDHLRFKAHIADLFIDFYIKFLLCGGLEHVEEVAELAFFF